MTTTKHSTTKPHVQLFGIYCIYAIARQLSTSLNFASHLFFLRSILVYWFKHNVKSDQWINVIISTCGEHDSSIGWSPAPVCRQRHCQRIRWFGGIYYGKILSNNYYPRYQDSWGQHGAHLCPVGPRWTPFWPHESWYQGQSYFIRDTSHGHQGISNHWQLNCLFKRLTTKKT